MLANFINTYTIFINLSAIHFMMTLIFLKFIEISLPAFKMKFKYLVNYISNSHLLISSCKPTLCR